MANILTPFGFQHIGYREGFAPTFGRKRCRIASTNTNPIFHGDAVIQLATGYIGQPTSNALTIAGVFEGCEYLSISTGRKTYSRYWPGADAAADVDAFVIDTLSALFVGQVNGTPILFSDIGANIGVFTATGGSASPTPGSGQGNTSNGLSGMLLDSAGTNSGGTGAVATTSTLPFRIVDLWSSYKIPGAPNLGGTQFNGTDNTTNYNWVVVAANNFDQKTLLGTV
jgi:hypothetical protein